MNPTARPVVVGPDEGLLLEAAGNRITLKVTSEHTERFSLIDFWVRPGFTAPPMLHFQEHEDWAAVVTEGELVFVFEDGEVLAPVGSVVFVPRGAPFAWRNAGDQPARYLAVHAPAGFERFFVDVAAALEDRGEATPEVMAEVIPPLWQRYGVQPVPPR